MMKIHVYTFCWNEEEILPFFLKHYEQCADKIIAYDNMSNDKTPEILAAHPLCERRTFDTGERVQENVLCNLKNNVWKESRGEADWVIVCDADEFIYHPHLLAYLSSCRERGVTIPQPTGFNMISDVWPEPDKQLWEQITEGSPDLFFSKKAVFNPDAITEMNYQPGAHTCSPTGRIREEKDPTLKLLHYKYIGGLERLRERRARVDRRLSSVNTFFGWTQQAKPSDVAKEYNYEKSRARPLNLGSEPTTGEAPRRRILFIGGIGGLSGVSRLAGLAYALDPQKYEVHFACAPDDKALFTNPPFDIITTPTLPARNAQERAAQGKPIFDVETLDEFLWEDIFIIRETGAEVVVGDMRQSLAIGSRLAPVTYLNIVNAQWSPASRLPLELPRNPLAPFLGQHLSDLLFSLAAPLGFSPHVVPLNLLSLKYGLPPLVWDVRQLYCFGDMTLYPDVPELVPTAALPPTHHYIGPVLWSPEVAEPVWWQDVPEDKPIVYVNLGSSGQGKLLRVVFDALARLPLTVIAATAGADAGETGVIPPNAFVAEQLPEREAAKRSQVVICNGGNMSAQQALACGVPVLSLASNLDQMLFARAVSNAGAGEALREAEADAGAIRQLTWRMLKRASYAEAARRMATAYTQREAALNFNRLLDSVLTKPADAPA